MNKLRERLNQAIGEKKRIEKDLSEEKALLIDLQDNLEVDTKCRWLVSEAIEQTQANFKKEVESLVTMAIRAVFDESYQFELIFEKKYGDKFFCTPVINAKGVIRKPKDDMGGSVINIISFSFKVVLWSVEDPRSRNTLVLDEPMSWVGQREELILAGRIIKEVAKGLSLQIIIITHSPEFAEIADTVYEVENDRVRSSVKLVKGSFEKRKIRKLRR